MPLKGQAFVKVKKILNSYFPPPPVGTTRGCFSDFSPWELMEPLEVKTMKEQGHPLRLDLYSF